MSQSKTLTTRRRKQSAKKQAARLSKQAKKLRNQGTRTAPAAKEAAS